jgi:hypothetical protein
MVSFMSYLRIAYNDGKIADDIKAALADSALKLTYRKHLTNLSSLFEFFIPAVNATPVSVVVLIICCKSVSY